MNALFSPEIIGLTVSRDWLGIHCLSDDLQSRCRHLAMDYERSFQSSLAWARLAACRFMVRLIGRAVKC